MRETSWRVWASAFALVLILVEGVLIAVHANPFASLDRSINHWVVDQRSTGMNSFANLLTDVFSPGAIVAITLVVTALFCWRDRALKRGVTVLGAVALASALCEVLKLSVDRPRPPAWTQLSPEATLSYPSGHVSGTTALLLIVALTLTAGAANNRWRWMALGAASLIAVIVAASRVYAGAHWPSDVVAGLLVGSIGVLVAPVVVDAVWPVLLRHAPAKITRWLELPEARPSH